MDERLKICQTCLSGDRLLYPLVKLKSLLKELNLEIKLEGSVCWECRCVIQKCFNFRTQAYRAQNMLNACKKIKNIKSLSALSAGNKYFFYAHFDPKSNVNITCNEAGPILIRHEVTESVNEEKREKPGRSRKSNELLDNNVIMDDHVNLMSKLPRITLVESITDQTLEPNKETQSDTEIIELNIPIPHPILVEDDDDVAIENHSDAIQNHKVETLSVNQEDKPEHTQNYIHKESGLHAIAMERHTIKTNASKRKDTVQSPANETSHHSNPSAPGRSSDIPSILVLDNRTEEYDDVQHQSSLTERRNNSEENSSKSCNNDVIDVNKKSSKRDTITLKVAFIGRFPGTGRNAITIKDEPVSDSEDVQMEADDGVNVSREIKAEMIDSVEAKRESELWRKSVMLVYNSIRAHKYASRFTHPITDVIAPDYSLVVKRPIDLNTIKRKIKNGIIKTTAEFQRDILLMLSNALMYNGVGHSVHNMAQDLLEEAKYQLGLLITVHANSALPDITPSRRPKRHIVTESKQPPSKMRRVTFKTEKNLITPKVEKITPKVPKKVTPKVEQVTLKVQKKVTPKVEKKSTSREERKSLVCKVDNTLKAGSSKVEVTPKVATMPARVSIRTRRPTYKEMPEIPTPKPRKSTYKVQDSRPEDFKMPLLIPKMEKPSNQSSVMFDKKPKHSRAKANYTSMFMDDMMGCSQVLDDLCVAITTEPQRDLTRDEASSLKKFLEEKILNLALDFSKFAPMFRGEPIIADGVIKLWCEDNKSLKWLNKTISKLPKKMGCFVVRKQADLPTKIKSAILIPGYNGEVEIIKKILKAQNAWAHVDSWAVYSAEQRGESLFLVIGVPTTVIPVLLARQRRLAYSLGSVYIKFYTLGGKLSDLPPELS